MEDDLILLWLFGDNETTSSPTSAASLWSSKTPTIESTIVPTEMMSGGTFPSAVVDTAGNQTSIPSAFPSPASSSSSSPLANSWGLDSSNMPSLSPSTLISSGQSTPRTETSIETESNSFRITSSQANSASNAAFSASSAIATMNSTNWILLVTAFLLSVAALATVIWARHLTRQWSKRLEDEHGDQRIRRHSGHDRRSLSSAHLQGQGVTRGHTSSSDSLSARTGGVMMSYRENRNDLWVVGRHLDTYDGEEEDSVESDSGWNDTESSVDEEDGYLQSRNDLIGEEDTNYDNSVQITTVGEDDGINEIILSYSSFIDKENQPYHELVSL